MNNNTIPLNEFITLQRGHDLPHSDRVVGDVPVIASTGIAGYHNEAKAKAPGVVIGRSGSIGGGQYITQDFWPLNTTLWVKDFKGHNERYVHYLLRNIDFTRFNVGSGVPTLNRNHLSSILIENIGIDSENAIAKILGDLDDKIHLNTQINQTLEQIAQALFKSWFVDFDPVKAKMAVLESGGTQADAERAAMKTISGKDDAALEAFKNENPEGYAELEETAEMFPAAMVESELGMIPEGWEIGKLSELIEFNPKRTLKKGTIAPYLDMKNVPSKGHLANEVTLREMKSGTKFINGDTLLARITPCLENGKTAYVDFLRDNEVGWGSTEYIVMRPRKDIPKSVGYFIARNNVFRMFAIQSMTGTSGRQRADAKVLAELPWLVYPHEILSRFGEIAENMLGQAKGHGNQNKNLARIRNTLLPKLLSGEIEPGKSDGAAK